MKSTSDMFKGETLNEVINKIQIQGIRAFRAKDIAILFSFLFVMALLTLLFGNIALALVFSGISFFVDRFGLQDNSTLVGLQGTIVYALVLGGGILIGRYIWMIAMSPVLSKADIAPFLAYGSRVRRMNRFDVFLLDRLYKK